MPRKPRNTPGGLVYHVLNRSVGRMTLFRKPADYAAFERCLLEAHARHPTRLLAYCVMPNHWHLILWPRRDGELTKFIAWLTMTHAQRWRHARALVGLGPLYQGRFKAFPVQTDPHFLTVARYVERNPVRAGLAARAQDWPYTSARARSDAESSANTGRHATETPDLRAILAPWPLNPPDDYLNWVNRPQTPAEEQAVRTSVTRSRPFGSPTWTTRTVARLGLESTLRPVGRPRKHKQKDQK